MRIVSLCPSFTELVFDLGLGDELVGITRYCVHPAQALERIETVGGTKDPDVARIAALEPDLVLMNEEENRREDHAALTAAGVPVHACFPKDVAGTARTVRTSALRWRATSRPSASPPTSSGAPRGCAPAPGAAARSASPT